MGIPWISALLLATCLGIVTSVFNPKVCQVIKESYGLVPPPIPTNFEWRGEHVDYVKKSTIYEEMYFDYANSRGKYMYLLKGIEHHFLFDYDVQQVVAYDILHPGVDIREDVLSRTCTAGDMEESEYKDIFGVVPDTKGGRSRMYTPNQALRFGGTYAYAYNGTDRMENRGLLVDKFIGCLYYDANDATINSTFLFTSKANIGVGSSAGTMEKEVTGIDCCGLLSVPVQANLHGSAIDKDDDEVAHLFNATWNYFWFKGEPEFKMGTFQLPPYLYCNKYRGRKNMPKFPTAFDTRIQKTTLQRDILGKLVTSEVTSFENVMYYQEKNLARRDFTPGPRDGDIKWKFQNSLPVKTIYDFNQGLLYVTNIASGRCYVRPINHGDFFEASKEDVMWVTMGTPEHIFQMETDEMEYKGKDFTRDIQCDVWAGKYKDKIMNATYAKETYISTNGWHEETDELVGYGVPIKHTIIQEELEGELVEGVTAYSFLKFKPKAPLLRRFDVSNCIETQTHRDFAILPTISEETKKLLLDYKVHFLDTLQYYISDVTQMMSPLRVQRLQFRTVSNANPRPIILVTLVDKIKLKTKIPVGQRGASLDEAAAYLQMFIDRNQFAVKFYPPNSKNMTLVPCLKGSLYVKTVSGDLTYYAPVPEIETPSSDEESISEKNENPSVIMFDNPVDFDDEEAKGMSSGSLALLGITMLFIGIGIGVAVMYLYLRHQSESKMEDRIHLSMQASGEEPKTHTVDENAQ